LVAAVRWDPGGVNPRVDLVRVEPEQPAPLDIRNAPLVHQAPDVPDLNAKADRYGFDVHEARPGGLVLPGRWSWHRYLRPF
jgi:hypothetical protein